MHWYKRVDASLLKGSCMKDKWGMHYKIKVDASLTNRSKSSIRADALVENGGCNTKQMV